MVSPIRRPQISHKKHFNKKETTILILTVVFLVMIAGISVVLYIDDYAPTPQRVATLPLSEMKTLTEDNFTLWLPSSNNANYTVAYYNLTSNASLHGYITIMSVSTGTNSSHQPSGSSMYNETFYGVRNMIHNFSSIAKVSNGTFRGFHYFIVSIKGESVFISAGYAGHYFFYIMGSSVEIPNTYSIVSAEINAMCTK